MNLSGHKILITGGASGIGLGFTERFIGENNQVIICGRRNEELKKVSSRFPSAVTRVCDLSVEAERIALYDWIAKEHPDLTVLVNNAGIQNWMSVADSDFYERAKTEVTTNVLAPVHLITLFLKLPSLKVIMNVTSGLAFVQLTKVPVYCATKAFFHSFTVSLRHLLKSKNVEVVEVIPPALNTDLGGKGLHDEHPPVGAFIESVFNQLKEGKNELTFGFSEMLSKAPPETVSAVFDRMNSSN